MHPPKPVLRIRGLLGPPPSPSPCWGPKTMLREARMQEKAVVWDAALVNEVVCQVPEDEVGVLSYLSVTDGIQAHVSIEWGWPDQTERRPQKAEAGVIQEKRNRGPHNEGGQ